jgi:hypothetical protein
MTLREEWDALDGLLAAPAEPVKLRPYQVEAIARINDASASNDQGPRTCRLVGNVQHRKAVGAAA